MITIKVCTDCNKGSCKPNDGIQIYEYVKAFIDKYLKEELELDVQKCGCLGICKGPVVIVEDKVYTNVSSYDIDNILMHLLINGRKTIDR